MDVVLRVLPALVLLGSGVLKLRDPDWPAAARGLGAPGWVVPLVAPAEIALGSLLAAGLAPPAPAWAAAGLFAVFAVPLAVALRKPVDERPRCACFGRWSAKPVSWWSFGRNAVFCALAVAAALAA